MKARAQSSRNLVELACERAATRPERVAVRFLSDGESTEETLSHGQLHQRACALAATLAEMGPAGERALILHPSGPDYLPAFLGCLYAGWIAVPAHPPESLQPRHLARLLGIVRNARPRVVLAPRALAPVIARVLASMPEAAHIQTLATDALELERAADWRMPALRESSVAFLQYTSGSTAEPKGVSVGHDNLMANQALICSAFALQESDVVVSWLPLFHDMGLVGTLLQPLFSGASLVLFSAGHFIERPLRWLRAISRFAGSVSGGPDFAYRLCAERAKSDSLEGIDLASWRLAFSGAEPVRAGTLRGFSDRFAPAGFRAASLYPCYGLAESTLLVTGGLAGSGPSFQSFDPRALAEHRVLAAPTGRELVAAGRPQPGHPLCIVDPGTGERVPEGQIGEVWVSGPSVAQGYFENAEATREVFVRRGDTRFLRTGDLGFQHQGELFITGRHKDVIIVRGHNIYPSDVESAVEVSVPVLRKGRIAAFGVETAGSEAIAVAAEVNAKVQKWIEPDAACRSIVEAVAAEFGEAPSLVLLLHPGALPMTSSGKLRRGACRRAWEQRTLDAFAIHELGNTRPSDSSAQSSASVSRSPHDNQ